MLYTKDNTKTIEAEAAPIGLFEGLGNMEVLPISLNSLHDISSIKIHLPNDLTKTDSKNIILETLRGIMDKFNKCPPLLDPVKDMKIDDE